MFDKKGILKEFYKRLQSDISDVNFHLNGDKIVGMEGKNCYCCTFYDNGVFNGIFVQYNFYCSNLTTSRRLEIMKYLNELNSYYAVNACLVNNNNAYSIVLTPILVPVLAKNLKEKTPKIDYAMYAMTCLKNIIDAFKEMGVYSKLKEIAE